MPGFIIATVLSAILLCVSAAFAVYTARKPYLSSRLVTPSRVLAVGIFFAGWVLFFPHYFMEFSSQPILARLWETFWVAAHHTVRLFVIDTGFEEIFSSAIRNDLVAYAVIGTILFIAAPIMTAGVILSFFRNFASYVKCFTHRRSDAYIFSELSEKSLALASDLAKNHKDAVLIFTDVFEENNEASYELCERARMLGAVCFRKDIASLNLKFFTKTSKLHFFAIGEDESENVRQAFTVSSESAPYAQREGVFLYVFSTDVEGELLLSNLPETKIRVRRVDDIRSLVHRNLYDSGEKLFSNAILQEDGTKLISALVVGTGGHGREMLKALAWFCQMEGYRIEIHAFDIDAHASDRFALEAPELLSPRNNGVYVEGEAQYRITFHDGVSVDDARCARALEEANAPTYIFVSTGEDARNVRAAVFLRRYFRQKHLSDPIIQAIVYDSKNQDILNEAHNFKGQPYEIEFVGAREEMYSERVILRQDLEEEARKTHMSYGADAESFYRFEYNYRSSMASALHRHLRSKLGVADFDDIDAVSEQERDLSERIEHRRWNAYMRSEGFVYSGSPEKASRDDLAKMHHNLVPFDALSEEDKRKDSTVAIGRK